MSDLRNALQKGAANVINGHANQLRIQIEENDVLRAERDALRAALAKIRRDYSSAFMPEDAARIDAALKDKKP